MATEDTVDKVELTEEELRGGIINEPRNRFDRQHNAVILELIETRTEVKRQATGWSEAFRLAVHHQDRADSAEDSFAYWKNAFMRVAENLGVEFEVNEALDDPHEEFVEKVAQVAKELT